MSRTYSATHCTWRALALLSLLAASGAWAQPQSCASQAAAANATSPGLDQRLRENAQQFDTDFLRERIARAKLTAGQDSARALTVCIFEQELASRSGRSTVAASPAAAPLRDDPKVFGRSARGG
jgi:hypothetical protein